MIPELLILAFALVLLLYWLRYNCHAMLQNASSDERARQVASANNLSFPEVAERVKSDPDPEELAAMHHSLSRDYRVLTALLVYTYTPVRERYTIEQRMLMLDFRVLSAWFAATHGLLYGFACRSLTERSRILNYFASLMGERTAVFSRG